MILSVLSSAIRCSAIPLFFLITSWPEQDICQSFNEEPLNSLPRRLVSDENYKPDKIFRFSCCPNLTTSRNTILRNTFCQRLRCWPSDCDVERLVTKSSGQFINSPRHQPTDLERLNMILGLQLESTGKKHAICSVGCAIHAYILSIC